VRISPAEFYHLSMDQIYESRHLYGCIPVDDPSDVCDTTKLIYEYLKGSMSRKADHEKCRDDAILGSFMPGHVLAWCYTLIDDRNY
jgi:hypothetical protein